MNSPRLAVPASSRSRLRATLATIEREISSLPRNDSGGSPNRLRASFTELVEQLALGPEPEVRQCPVCRHMGMRAATLCGYCWTKRTPPTERDGVVG